MAESNPFGQWAYTPQRDYEYGESEPSRIWEGATLLATLEPTVDSITLARRMAANPDLLEACQAAAAHIRYVYDAAYQQAAWYNNHTPGVGQELDYMPYPTTPDVLILLEAVIRKANGEPPPNLDMTEP